MRPNEIDIEDEETELPANPRRSRGYAFATAAMICVIAIVMFFMLQIQSKRNTELYFAVKSGDILAVKKLLDAGADPNFRMVDNKLNPLVVDALGSNLTSQQHFGQLDSSVLSRAARLPDSVITAFLLDSGAIPRTCGSDGALPLSSAIYAGSMKNVALLLSRGAKVTPELPVFIPPLLAASIVGNEQIVSLLISKGAEVNSKGPLFGPALVYAAYRGQTAAAVLLIKSGAQVNLSDPTLGTPMDAALKNGHRDTAAAMAEASKAIRSN